jgi:AcrR family transcriptional regulator
MARPPRNQVDALARKVVKTSQKALGVPKPRRTQAERRAATRAALLDAAMACLVEDGYANLTTRRIAERAGVSQGTQQHYFKTKTEFVVEAMRYATQQITADVLRRIDIRSLGDPARQEVLLDEIWAVHKSAAFKASLELWIAARSDDELRRNMRKLEREISATIGDAARKAIPEQDRTPELLELVDVGLATVRGYAMLAPVVPPADLERRWAMAKKHLLVALHGVAPPVAPAP